MSVLTRRDGKVQVLAQTYNPNIPPEMPFGIRIHTMSTKDNLPGDTEEKALEAAVYLSEKDANDLLKELTKVITKYEAIRKNCDGKE